MEIQNQEIVRTQVVRISAGAEKPNYENSSVVHKCANDEIQIQIIIIRRQVALNLPPQISRIRQSASQIATDAIQNQKIIKRQVE